MEEDNEDNEAAPPDAARQQAEHMLAQARVVDDGG